MKFVGYSDSDWDRDLDERKFTHDYAYFLSLVPIAWLSKKKYKISLSPTNVECNKGVVTVG